MTASLNHLGFLFTYIAPLVFVLLVTMFKEAFEDIRRRQRDKVMNNTKYEVLSKDRLVSVCSEDIKVGQIVKVLQG